MRGTLLTFSLLLISNLLFGQFGEQEIVSIDADGAYRVIAADLDGDGPIDILSLSALDDKINWHRNLDGLGSFSNPILIDINPASFLSFWAADLDTDSNLDLIFLENNPNILFWMKNIDGQGNMASKEIILESQEEHIYSVSTADLDNDLDLDLIVEFGDTFIDRIVAFENVDGNATFGSEIELINQNIELTTPLLVDIDNDGLKDILIATDGYDPAKIIWFKNLGGGNFGSEQEIYQFDFFQSDWTSIIGMQFVDINTDGKKDIIADCINEDTVGSFYVWLENIDNEGNFYDPENLEVVNAFDSYYDIDNDGDNDVIRVNSTNNEIYWIENEDGLGNFETIRIISQDVENPRNAICADFNGDGLLDVASASFDDDKIAWYPNTGILGFSEKNIPPISIFPNPTNDKVFLKTERSIEKVIIYNALGTEVLKVSDSKEINVEKLPQGIYWVKILFENGSVTSEKLIKY